MATEGKESKQPQADWSTAMTRRLITVLLDEVALGKRGLGRSVTHGHSGGYCMGKAYFHSIVNRQQRLWSQNIFFWIHCGRGHGVLLCLAGVEVV
jgi:hypothetical protein